jgi:hypothetical protein
MYNLGSQRTLTLVNGMRFVSPASSSIFGAVAGSPVDLSQIAPNLVERVEVVSVGGAPIYGSDAIAGTINFILKKNFQGSTSTVRPGFRSTAMAKTTTFPCWPARISPKVAAISRPTSTMTASTASRRRHGRARWADLHHSSERPTAIRPL